MNILAFADLHAHAKSMEELRKKATLADIIIGAGDLSLFGHKLKEVMTFLASFSQPVLLLHGNHESEEDILSHIKKDTTHFLHGETFLYQDVFFVGWGGAGFSVVDHAFKAKADYFFSLCKNHQKVVFVTHQPPYGTKLDYIYGHYAGNKSYTAFIKRVKPLLAISGHLHETAKKQDYLGKTMLVNPGRDGMILTV